MIKNNKGITIVELIISFAIVSVATIYFFQTFYTVKKIYFKTREKSKEYADVNYAFRMLYEKGQCDNSIIKKLQKFNNTFSCRNSSTEEPSGIIKIELEINGKNYLLYKYNPNAEGLLNQQEDQNSSIFNDIQNMFFEGFTKEDIDIEELNSVYNYNIIELLFDDDDEFIGFSYEQDGMINEYLITSDPDPEGLNPNGEFNGNDGEYDYTGEGDETVTPNIDDDLWW